MTSAGSGHGTLTIENGGTVTNAFAVIAERRERWQQRDGYRRRLDLEYRYRPDVGDGGSGSLSILAGGTVNIAEHAVLPSVYVGQGTNGAGTVIVDNGTLRGNGSEMLVGVFGNPGSTLTVQNGGLVVGDFGAIGVGPFAGSSTGVVTVTGAGSLWDAARDSAGNVDPPRI